PPGHILQVALPRHGRIPPEPKAGLISGWGDWTGAVATTVAHDTHNLVVFGVDPQDMAAPRNPATKARGGGAGRARSPRRAPTIPTTSLSSGLTPRTWPPPRTPSSKPRAGWPWPRKD